MDNLRFVLIMAFVMISYMLWEAWQFDYGPKPQLPVSDTPVVTSGGADAPAAGGELGTPQKETAPLASDGSGRIIRVKTDVYALEIDTQGGTLSNLDLLQYPKEKPNTVVNKLYKMVGLEPDAVDTSPVRLFDSSEDKLFLAQSGLVGANGSSAPDHHAVYAAKQDSYELAEGADTLTVPLTWSDDQGITITKTYTFKRGSYDVHLEHKISNNSGSVWSGRQYNQLLRKPFSERNSNNFIRTYAGGVVYTNEEKYQKVDFEDMAEENLNVKTVGGWTAMIQHYFASAWIPPQDQENHFYTKELKDWRYVIGSYSPAREIAPNAESVFKAQLFVGPKIQPQMEAVAKGLELTVDYSWLTIIAKPIYWLLNQIHGYIGNWGLAIMGVTLVIKLLFYRLSKSSYTSMAKMRKIQPKLKELQDKFKDDRQKFNTEMMAMYKREKVNPLGGCLPILVQIPVFISLYWVLIETVELRQAEFYLWIQDLSAQDPFYLLPILYGVTMKIQQSLNPAPVDPLQAKVMKMFPIIFTVFFLFFPSGLVLYWVWNNSLSILQQWHITRQIEAGDKK
ncbi:membrane protein insertase YidC [Methylomarinum vadi]|uniref:membrane protein insertase YidC n=1 Tax=Methylomarinum vadi TaxID=438855 RepID=UPI0004DF1CAE|nr:membrane protein insertase YidC [Methylomarinum vadi]